MWKLKLMGLVVLSLALLVTLGAFSQGQGLEKITFRLNWIPQGNHAIFYVAKDLGYYRDVGLDVTIERGTGSADAVALVDAKKVDLGMADCSTVAVSRGRGARVKVIAEIYVTSPFTIWTRKDTGIREPKDLAGHTIGAPPGDSQRVFFPAFAKAVGLDPDSVTWVNIGPGDKITFLAAKKIDATVHYADQLYLYEKAVGKDNLVYFRWPDYGVNPYAKSLIAHEDTIKNRPDMIKRFLEASFKAWRWTLLHPKKALEIEQKYVPEMDMEKFQAMLEVSIRLMQSPETFVHGLGWIDLDRMQKTVDLVNQYFDLPRKLTAKEMFTTEFLPHYTWPYPYELDNPATWPDPYEFEYTPSDYK